MKRFIAFVVAVFMVCQSTLAQPGMVDPLFNTADIGYGDGPNSVIYALAEQSTSKFLIGGGFTQYDAVDCNYIARLLPDGSYDPTFQMGSGFSGSVYDLLVTADDKILVVGSFNSYNGISCGKLTRLNSDGTLDGTFNLNLSISGTVYDFIQLSDGGLLAVGSFYTVDGIDKRSIARFDSNGNLDVTFGSVPGTPISYGVTFDEISVQADEKIIVSGSFTAYEGVSRKGILRLNGDGSLDLSFDPGSGANSNSITSHQLLSDGRLLLSGSFTTFNGVAASRLVMLNSNGSVDETFVSEMPTTYNLPDILQLQDQTILVAGSFSSYGTAVAQSIVKLNFDGTMDASFNSGLAPSSGVGSMIETSTGRLLAAGSFSWGYSVNSWPALLESDGSLVQGFHERIGFNGAANAITVELDSSIVIAGSMTRYGTASIGNIKRILSNGNEDPNFAPVSGANSTINCLANLPDGKYLIGGSFSTYDGISRVGIARLNSNGTLDETFVPNANSGCEIKSMALQQDGKIVVGGEFSAFDGIEARRVARLNSDGSLDQGFNTNIGHNYFHPLALAVQLDENILVGGYLSSTITLDSSTNIFRLNPDGTIDSLFVLGTGASYVMSDNDDVLEFEENRSIGSGPPPGPPPPTMIYTIAIQSDGRILVGGSFNRFNGVLSPSIARLNSDGTLDGSFLANFHSAFVKKVLLQPDGQILAAGSYSFSENAPQVSNTIRLNTDGTLDQQFYFGEGSNSQINTLAFDQQGRILAGGFFNQYNGVGRNRIVRLLQDGMLVSDGANEAVGSNHYTFNAYQTNGQITISAADLNGQVILFDMAGRIVASTSMIGGQGVFQIQPPAGVYIVQLIHDAGSESRKVYVN